LLSQQLPDFVDLEFARRPGEVAETTCRLRSRLLRRYRPSFVPVAAEEIAGGVAFFGGLDYPPTRS